MFNMFKSEFENAYYLINNLTRTGKKQYRRYYFKYMIFVQTSETNVR